MMKEFEKASDEINKDANLEYEVENAIEWIKGKDIATVTFSQGRYITKIEKLAKKFPEEVQIVARNKNSIVAHIPVSFIKINNPQKRELSDAEKEMLIERLRISRENTDR